MPALLELNPNGRVPCSATGLDIDPYARVRAWLSRVLARDSMRRALADGRASMRSHAA
ncbi:MAG: hypothetical protein M3O46_18450 [Myxococcota bacterium]|nr:hypothetical protein [Myxococcota bacterium]